MSASNFIESLSLYFLTPAFLISAITYLSKRITDNFFNARQSDYKKKIDIELSNIKTIMENKQHEFKVKIGGIFERKANVLIEFYALISELEMTMNALMNFDPNDEEKFKLFSIQYYDLKAFYCKNQILFPSNCEELIEDFIDSSFWSIRDYVIPERQLRSDKPLTLSSIDSLYKKQDNAVDLFKQIRPIKNKIRENLREQLGID